MTRRHLAPDNSALEQEASAARPWRADQGKTVAQGGPRPVRKPLVVTAGVRWRDQQGACA